ncbi:DUF2505 domain-containing protein [Aquihabitans daechungensis]|uniref:DUF2505 domain-containing protein n=1 Tax=Aquihabitans daechungensis TaxID=1052257 RepID=UPI003BA0858C
MRFEISQEFRHEPRAVDEAYTDPALYPTLVGLPNLGDMVVLSHQRDGDTARLRIHVKFLREFSPAVAAAIDPGKLSWVQESTHDLAAGTTTFRFVPDNYADRFSADGRTRIAARGDGAVRTLSGEVKVRAPLVGGRVEKAIVEGLEEYLAAEAALVDRFIDS